jgi:hypothetical protein
MFNVQPSLETVLLRWAVCRLQKRPILSDRPHNSQFPVHPPRPLGLLPVPQRPQFLSKSPSQATDPEPRRFPEDGENYGLCIDWTWVDNSRLASSHGPLGSRMSRDIMTPCGWRFPRSLGRTVKTDTATASHATNEISLREPTRHF